MLRAYHLPVGYFYTIQKPMVLSTNVFFAKVIKYLQSYIMDLNTIGLWLYRVVLKSLPLVTAQFQTFNLFCN